VPVANNADARKGADPPYQMEAVKNLLSDNCHCVITGGAGSIGLATARLLRANGARVFLVDRDAAALAAVAEDGMGWCAADVSSAEDTARYVAQACALFGPIDVLFANAGIAGVVSPVAHYPDDVFDEVMAVSVRGSFLAAKHAVPVMRDGGSIIFMSSVMGLTADPGVAAYATAKHAVVGLMRVLAKELAPRGIRVNSIHPGPVDNRFQSEIEAALTPILGVDGTEFLNRAIPLGRHARAEEIAQTVLYLASAMSSFVTGATLPVDGGMAV
jgi:NAD(P)-dependent dehydrogenase (short-subunit alcohol dehydrogenase family)